jgi:hypothetical protein
MAKRQTKPQISVYLDQRMLTAVDKFVVEHVADKAQVFRVGFFAYASASPAQRKTMAAEFAKWETEGFPAFKE